MEDDIYEQDDPFAFSDPYETMLFGDAYRFEDLNSSPDDYRDEFMLDDFEEMENDL